MKKTSIGGQALIEGIMMKGPYNTAMAVRKTDGSIEILPVEEKHLKDKCAFFGIPIVRGMVTLVESMMTGYKAMMTSADVSGFTEFEEEPDGKTDNEQPAEDTAETAEAEASPEKKEPEKMSGALIGIVTVIGVVLGLLLAVALFMYVPTKIFEGIQYLVGRDMTPFKALIEGILKIAVFIAYIAIVSFEKDIKRVFMYHGAEHKTIFCYEHGDELTVENVRRYKRFHPRCGTSFIFLMLVVGILIGTVLTFVFNNCGLGFIVAKAYLWVPIKILLVPLTCGLGYELIRFCGRHDNALTRIIAAPGLWIQRLTTKEPDDGMIECAIKAVEEVIPEDGADEL